MVFLHSIWNAVIIYDSSESKLRDISFRYKCLNQAVFEKLI